MILTERFKVNGAEVAISGYTVKTPTGGLGESVTVALSKPDLALVPEDAVITFELGAGKETAPGVITYSWVTILDTGRRDGRSYSVKWIPDDNGGFPGDILEISALSPLADKWGLAPLLPLIMYNPDKIAGETLTPDESELLRRYDSSNNATYLYPYLEPCVLTLYYALNRAYTAAAPIPALGTNPGFSHIVTNIPNYPIDRVDISPETGWHGGVAGLYSVFNPVVFAADNILYIIDPENGLPPGFIPRQLELDCVIEVNESIQAETLTNAIVLSYKTEAGGGVIYAGEIPSIRIIHEQPYESGSGRSYTRTEVTRKITEFRDLISGELRRVEENEIETLTYAYRDNIVIGETDGQVTRERQPGGVTLVSREVIQNTYVGNTKAGHTRTVEGRYYDPDASGGDTYGEVFTETCRMDWTADSSHPGESILKRSETSTAGLVMVETGEDGFDQFTPILDATRGGLVGSDGTQTIIQTPIETTIEELRTTGVNQSIGVV